MEARRETPQERYEKKMIRRISLKLNRKTDADILDHLEGVENFQGYIKQLIRSDIQAQISEK